MMTKTYLLCCSLALGSLGAQAQFVPVTRNANIATSVNYPVNEGGIHSYMRMLGATAPYYGPIMGRALKKSMIWENATSLFAYRS